MSARRAQSIVLQSSLCFLIVANLLNLPFSLLRNTSIADKLQVQSHGSGGNPSPSVRAKPEVSTKDRLEAFSENNAEE